MVPPPAIDYMSFINPDALALYGDVETPDQFRVASLVFWYAYSAWIRDVPSSEIATIFNDTIWPKTTENCNIELEKAIFREIFETEYEGMSRLYKSKVLEYCDMYMNSEAGKALANDVEIKRRSGKKIPGISIEVLTKGYKGHPGIEWGHQQVYDFFEALQSITETSPIGSDDEKFWFTADLDPETNNYVPGGWYERLQQYAYNCVAQAIARKCDMRPSGGNRYALELSRAAIKSLLSLVPVLGLEGKRLSAPFHFPLDKQSLRAWVSQFSPEMDSVGPATTRTNKMADMLEDAVDGCELTKNTLQTALNAEAESQVQRAELIQLLQDVMEIEAKPEVNIVEVQDSQNYSAPPKMYAPEISPEDYAFLSGNTKTRISLAIASATEARNKVARAIGIMQQEIVCWEKKINILEREREELAFNEEVGLQILERARSTGGRLDSLQLQLAGESSISRNDVDGPLA